MQTLNQIETTAATERALQRQSQSARRAAKRDRTSTPSVPGPTAPRRRSGRNQGQSAEFDGATLDIADPRSLRDNYQDEIYTSDHVNALGSSKEPWTLFVDGYDAQGNRIYDKVNGQTCHQCRQKTLGLRTCCSQCSSLHGVFCGDCLFMRYGENITEVNENKDWICPHCRDLCNCSFHRSRRGWAPTGQMYPHASGLGYASVAHYLVLGNLAPEAREAALPLMPEELAEETRAELAKEAAGGEAAVGVVRKVAEAGNAGGESDRQENNGQQVEVERKESGSEESSSPNESAGDDGNSPLDNAGTKRKAEDLSATGEDQVRAMEMAGSEGDVHTKLARVGTEEKENIN